MKPLEALMFALVKKFAEEFVPAPMREEFDALVPKAYLTLKQDQRLENWIERKIARIDTWQGVLQPPSQPTDVLATISTALLNNLNLKILYQSERREIYKEVYPLALLERDEVLYVVLNFYGYSDTRLVALHRILKADIVSKDAEFSNYPFKLDAFLRDGLPFSPPGEKNLSIHLRLDETTYRTFKGRPLRGTLSITEPIDGWFEVKAEGVPNTMELRWWLLGFGEKIRIVEPELLASELQYLLYDSLTGLLSRRTCKENLERLIATVQRTGKPSAVALIDIDHFKRINDELGHSAGDLVLVEVSRRLRAACRSMDLVGRWGGEEFLVLLPATSLQKAAMLSERLRDTIAATPFVVDTCGNIRTVTISIGVASCRRSSLKSSYANLEETVNSLLLEADKALYKAKKSRNRVEVFDSSMLAS